MGTASAQSHDEEEKDIYSKSLSLQRSASPSQKQTVRNWLYCSVAFEQGFYALRYGALLGLLLSYCGNC